MSIDDIRKKMLDIISKSETLKNNLTFKEQLNLYNDITKIENSKLNELHHKLSEEAPSPIKSNPKIEQILKTGLSVASLAIPIPGLALAVNYLVDINRYKCMVRVEKGKAPNKDLAMSNCRYRASIWGVKFVQGEVAKCGSTKNPRKCRNRLFKLLISQRQKMTKNEVKLRWSLSKAKQKIRK